MALKIYFLARFNVLSKTEKSRRVTEPRPVCEPERLPTYVCLLYACTVIKSLWFTFHAVFIDI